MTRKSRSHVLIIERGLYSGSQGYSRKRAGTLLCVRGHYRPLQPVSVLPHRRICDTQLTAEPAGLKAPGTGLSPSLVAVADS